MRKFQQKLSFAFAELDCQDCCETPEICAIIAVVQTLDIPNWLQKWKRFHPHGA
jgi:hypothetical protein